jgi:AAA domain
LNLIFIYGLPATGKLTVAQELSRLTGYRLFHNHLVVDQLLSVFEFGSAPFVELREQIWLSVFEQASLGQVEGLIFTFNPEKTVRPTFIGAAVDTVTTRGGEIKFVELVAPLAELKRRIDNPSRMHYRKLSSLAFFEELYEAGEFDTSHMPKPVLTIDTSLCSPPEAAAQIIAAI